MQTITGEKGASVLSKHITIRMKLLKQAYDGGEINLLKLSTTNMVADILTKGLGPVDYIRLRAVLQGYTPIIFDPPAEISLDTALPSIQIVPKLRLSGGTDIHAKVSISSFVEIPMDKDQESVVPKLRLRGGSDTPQLPIPRHRDRAIIDQTLREQQDIPVSRWTCSHCKNMNSYDDDSCHICNFQPRQDKAVWQCHARDCDEMNHYQDTICQSCGIADPNVDEYYTAPIHITLPTRSTSTTETSIVQITSITPIGTNVNLPWTFSDWYCAQCQEGNNYQDDACYKCQYQMRRHTTAWKCTADNCNNMNHHQDHICMLCGLRDPTAPASIHPPYSEALLRLPVSTVQLVPVELPVNNVSSQQRLSLRRTRDIDRYSDESEQRRQRIATADIVHPSARAQMRRASEYISPPYLPHVDVPGMERFYTFPSSAIGTDNTDLRMGTFTNTTIEPSPEPVLFWHGIIGDIAYADTIRHAGRGAYLMALRHPYKTPDGKNLYVNSAKHVAKNLCKASTVNCSIGAHYKDTGSPITPNCKLKYINGHPALYVIRTIFAGEELFWDYGRDQRSIRYYPWDEHQLIPLLYNWRDQFLPA